MKALGLDPAQYKYHSSDKDSTTLRHKDGHEVRIAHNVLSPKNQAILRALATTPQTEDPHPYGKVIQKADGGYVKEIHSDEKEPGYTKMADGGGVYLPCLNPNCKSRGKPHPNCRCYGMATGGKVSDVQYCAHGKPHMKDCEYYKEGGEVDTTSSYLIDPNQPPPKPGPGYSPDYQDKTTPQQDTARHAQEDADDSAFRQDNPSTQVNEDDGYTQYKRNMAKGGMPQQSAPAMMSSEQPFAKGGQPRKMYADSDEPVSQDDSAPKQTGLEKTMQEIHEHVVPWIKKQMGAIANNGQAPQDDSDQPTPNQSQAPQQSDNLSVGQATPPQTPTDLPQTQAAIDQSPDQTDPNQDNQVGMSTGPATPPDVNPAPPTQNPQQDAQQAVQHPALQDPKTYANAVYNNTMDEGRAWSQDLTNGHIEPETYQSLFGKKDTLGKIGTLFGLMLSGAGSGLAHQPNMLMDMMNKEIDRDMDAQKTSSQNRQNYIKMAQQHELNKANILTQATGRKLTDAETKNMLQDVNIKAKMFMQRSAVADLMKQVTSMPEGPAKQQAMTSIAMLYKNLDAQNSDVASRFAAGKALQQFGDAGSQQGNEGAYQQKQNMLRRAGQGDWADQNDQRHIPGISGQASGPVPQEAKQRVVAMNTLDNQINNLMNSVNQYKAMSLKGNFDPRVTGPMAVKAHETAALYNQTLDGLGMTEGRMDWLDKQIPSNPQKFMERLQGSVQKLQEVAKNNRMRRDMVLSGPGGLGFPNQKINTQLPDQGQQSQPMTSKSGRPIEYRNGKAYYVK